MYYSERVTSPESNWGMKKRIPLKTLVRELKAFVTAYAGGMYPQFVYGKSLDNGVVPVFYYHEVDRSTFTSHLRFLKENNYNTLVGDELYHSLILKKERQKKEVVLTFDDGSSNLYSVVYPLLKEFNFRAMAFVVPGWIGRDDYITWSQAKEMSSSKLVDIQSHSMTHSSVFVSSKIVDFYNPNYFHFALKDLSSGSNGHHKLEYGAPIFNIASRLSNQRRFYPDEGICRLCVDFVASNGDREFFRERKWRSDLINLIARYTDSSARLGRFESEVEQKQAIDYEVVRSGRRIESQISGGTVQHFAFPWHEAGILARKTLQQYGYRTMSMGLTKPYQHKFLNGDGLELARVNGDFLLTLPGEGRQNFGKVLTTKILNRIQILST
jgi:hypothetical protein